MIGYLRFATESSINFFAVTMLIFVTVSILMNFLSIVPFFKAYGCCEGNDRGPVRGK